MDPKVRELIEWIGKNAWRESRCATPDPAWHVAMVPLLDKIRDTFGVPESDIVKIVDGEEQST